MAGRRLTAILAADIAGYSALMSSNEIETVSALKGHQSVILPMVAGFEGRIIDTAGDGILAEFPSVLNAAKCAAAIQEVMLERNASVPPERRMQFRIGINQGDVLFDEHRIFGDGINIAARLEGLCEPGGICISSKVYDEIKGRFEVAYEDIGLHNLKNIPEPVRVYRIWIAGAPKKAKKPAARSAGTSRKVAVPAAIAATILILLLAGGGAWWALTPSQQQAQATPPAKQAAAEPERPAPVVTAKAEIKEPEPRVTEAQLADAQRPEPKPPLPRLPEPKAAEPAPAVEPTQKASTNVDAELDREKYLLADARNAPTPAQPKPAPMTIPPQPQAVVTPVEKTPPPAEPKVDIALLSRQGQQSARNNDYLRAKLYFDEILRIQPQNVEALNNRCWVMAILGELSAALKDCDDALTVKPNYVDALDSRGFVKLKIGMPGAAIVDYDAALRIQSQKASSLYGRGIARQRLGNTKEGTADIARAKAIDPGVAAEFANYGIR